PFSLFDQLGLHDCDLTGRSAKRNKPELQPKPKRFAERGAAMSTRHAVTVRRRRVLCAGGGFVHSLPSFIANRRCLAFTISDCFWRREFCSTSRPGRTPSTFWDEA